MAFESATYWQSRYMTGGNSGAGSYGHLALYKASFLNKFILNHDIKTVAELGCGDGAQLERAVYPAYVGYDISSSAVDICKRKFAQDSSKHFFCLNDVDSLTQSELALSLDVIYHLIEDGVFVEYMKQLFRIGSRYVIIYANGCAREYNAEHVKLRDFTMFISQNFPEWEMIDFERNPFYSDAGTDPRFSWSNFYVYRNDVKDQHPCLVVNQHTTAEAGLESLVDHVLSEDVFINRSTAEWREAVERCRQGSIIKVKTVNSGGALRSSLGVRGRYVTEILPEALGLPLGGDGEWWYGAIRRNPPIIVSLTTISSRIGSISTVLNSITRQSLIPDQIILNVSVDPYLADAGVQESSISEEVKFLESSGLVQINWVPNTGPFRKLLPVLEREWDSNCVIITADDDTIYPIFWIEEMYKAFLKDRCIIARRCNNMQIRDGKPLPYLDWTKPNANSEIRPEWRGLFTFPTGKDGILYHPGFFTRKVFDPKLREISPTGDDIVFKFCSMITRTNVRILDNKGLHGIGRMPEFPHVPGIGSGLWESNRRGLNDEYISNVIDYLRDSRDLDLGLFLRSV